VLKPTPPVSGEDAATPKATPEGPSDAASPERPHAFGTAAIASDPAQNVQDL
jgi:hypothetical protein